MKYRRIAIGESVIPEDAIALIEDIQTLERILDMLGTLRDRSITAPSMTDHERAKQEAQRMLRRIGFLLSGCHTIATDRLRHEYLAGRRIKRQIRTQTLSDVWQMLLE